MPCGMLVCKRPWLSFEDSHNMQMALATILRGLIADSSHARPLDSTSLAEGPNCSRCDRLARQKHGEVFTLAADSLIRPNRSASTTLGSRSLPLFLFH